VREGRDFDAALAQRRDVEADDVEAVEEVLTEASVGDTVAKRSRSIQEVSMYRRFRVCAAFLVWTLSASAEASVIQGPLVFEDHTYYLLDPTTWFAAEAEAVTLGGNLVAINSAAEQVFVYDTFTSNGTLDRNLWIGLTDSVVEGMFFWTSGDPFTYSNWNVGEPNNQGAFGNEDYAIIWSPFQALNGTWNDIDPERQFYGVAEVADAPDVPEPATITTSLTALAFAAYRIRRRR
jgi:hypothetical protein